LEGELLLEDIRPEFQFFEYGALDAELSRAASGDGKKGLELAILAVDDQEQYGPLYDPGAPFGEEEERELADRLLSRVEQLSGVAPRLIVLLPPSTPVYPGAMERTLEGDLLSTRIGGFSARLDRELSRRPGVEPFAPESALWRLGNRAFDPRLWELGRIRYTDEGFLSLAEALAKRILLHAGRGIKAVVVDLDNTLWGGIAGEDGVQGLALGGDYPGSCFREFQKELKRWKEAGILLAVASKNNLEDALRVLEGHPEMMLKRGDFDHLEIHWEPKTSSIRRILDAFNIGPDSVLFIDDNPLERDAVAGEFPDLRVLDLPEDPLYYLDSLRAIPWPLFTSSPGEGSSRGELQAQQSKRQLASRQKRSREEYLAYLYIRVRVNRDHFHDVPRIAQLHGKTNQFNLLPLRLGERQILEAMDDPCRMVLALRYADRFGAAGIIGAALAGIEDTTLVVETFLLSCRVIGLGVEYALLHALLACAPPEIQEIRLPYRETERNAPAREFLRTLAEIPPGATEIVVPRAGIPPLPEWIAVEQPNHEYEKVTVDAS